MDEGSRRFGKYDLAEVLGEGGMARVYRAVRAGPMGFRKEVALKQILPHVAKEEKLLRALINEARLGGHLRHRNVVEVYEFDQVGDTFYIAMEFIHGQTLERVLQRVPEPGRLPPRIVLQIALQVCAGLEYAHSATDEDGRPMRLVHRDLKPANLMIERDGVVKIMDFGIARAETNLFKTSTAAVTKGTPIYMSPEQVEGKPLDRRSDLFSLASVVAQMVTGETAFQGTQLYHVLQQVARADVGQVLAQVERHVPGIVPVLECAFEREPVDRYPTAAEMGRALTEVYDTLEGDESLGPWLAATVPPEETRTGNGPQVGTGSPTRPPTGPGILAPIDTTMSSRAAVPVTPGSGPTPTRASGDPAVEPMGAPTPTPGPEDQSRGRPAMWVLVGSLVTLLAVCLLVIAWLLLSRLPGTEPGPPRLADAARASGDGDAIADLASLEGGVEGEAADRAGAAGEADRVAAPESAREIEREPSADGASPPAETWDEATAAADEGEAVDSGSADLPPRPEDDAIVDVAPFSAEGDAGIGTRRVGAPGGRSRPVLPPAASFRGEHDEVDGALPDRIARGLAARGADRRASAAEDLEDHRSLAASETIEELVKGETDAGVRRQALEAGRKRRTAADTRIAAWALRNDPDPSLRVHAARLLASYGDPASMRPLCGALTEDGAAQVRVAVAEAIGEIGDESCLQALEHQLGVEEDPEVLEAIVNAIEKITG